MQKNPVNYIDKERPSSVSPEGGEYSPGSLQASPRGGLEGAVSLPSGRFGGGLARTERINAPFKIL